MSPRAKRIAILAAVAAGLVLAAGAVLLALYARGGGTLPPALSFLGPAQVDHLGPSGPEEAVLRTLRLAGYDRAAAGEDAGAAVLRIELAGVTSPADVELAWQTAAAASAVAFPRAGSYEVQLFGPGAEPLLAIKLPGEAARAAVAADDAAALRKAATFRHLLEEGAGG